jgi:hypothetical protein
METIFVNLPNDILSTVMSNLTLQSEEEYWQNLYKQRFSKNVLPYIDNQLKLVGYTLFETLESPQPCLNCYFSLKKEICLNCIYNFPRPSYFEFVSWNEIRKQTKYGKYYDSFEHYYDDYHRDDEYPDLRYHFKKNVLPKLLPTFYYDADDEYCDDSDTDSEFDDGLEEWEEHFILTSSDWGY